MITTPTNTWIALAAGQASNPANWSLGRAPITGDTVVFDNTSDNNCSWDLPGLTVEPNGIVMAVGYDGQVAQGSVDMAVASGGLNIGGGNLVGDPTKAVDLYDGNFNVTTGTYSTTTIFFRTHGVCSLGGGVTYYGMRVTSGSTTTKSASASIASGGLTLEPNAVLDLTYGTDVRYYASSPYSNEGLIRSSNGSIMAVRLYDGDRSIAFGAVTCAIQVIGNSTMGANRTLSLAGPTSIPSNLSVFSQHATYTCTVDTGGFLIAHRGLTLANAKSIINMKGSKVLAYGNLDTSAGAVDFGTSQYVQAAPGTIKTAGASQPFNDLIVRSAAAGSSRLSDIKINGIYAHVPPTSSSAFTITFDPNKEYTGKRRPVKKQIRKMIVWPSLADKMLLEDLEVPA